MSRQLARRTVLLILFTLTGPVYGQRTSTTYAIRGAKVVVEPGQILPSANVVIRDGLIVSVGPDVAIPPDAFITEGKGLIVYPGFIDAGSPRAFDATLRRSETGPPAVEDLASGPLAATKPDHRKGLTPEFNVQTALKLDEDAVGPWRKAGFAAQVVTPDGGYLSGTSTLVSLSGAVPREAVLKSPVALNVSLRTVIGADYPVSLMGVIAHCRQTFLDAGWLKRRNIAFESGGRVGKRPVSDPCLESLWPAIDGTLPVAFEADTADQIHRALDFAEEFHLKPIIFGGRDAWKVIDRLKKNSTPILLRFNFSEPAERESSLAIRVREDIERQRKLELACAAALQKAGVRFAISTQGIVGQQPQDKFRENVKRVIDAGLSPESMLAALTTDAAEILGVSTQIGKVTVGRSAHLTVCDGEFHQPSSKVRYVFSDGVRIDPAERTESLTAANSDVQSAPTGRTGRGGRGSSPQVRPTAPNTSAETTQSSPRTTRPAVSLSGQAIRALVPALDAVEQLVTEIDDDRKPQIRTGGDVLIRNATVLTAAGKNYPRADILICSGKISEIGSGLSAPKNVSILDASGMFVMPGIIDSHCHFAMSAGINESSLSVVPEVRVKDVVDSEDLQIYRALGGGVTTARLLHGSANVIGGQDAVLKMKYGRPAKELIVLERPQGVKFALGENVKRTDGRFPNSRPGVEAVLIRSFSEARAYRKDWEEYEKSKGTNNQLPEPRRDLRLEALSKILSGEIQVHSHCYRADEILMLLRVADKFGFKVKSLQHVLEGYKVAPEIVAHGASVSLFSDWWAYKVEAFDAIPYAAKLLHDAGAMVCLKSDDNELMRHLYQEAAKVVKYGGLSVDEAIKAITINPAKQIGVGDKTGSIEIGKSGDIAIFNGHPLNGYSRCEMTLIDGEVFFQRSDRFEPLSAAADPPAQRRPALDPIPEQPRGTTVLRGAMIHPTGEDPFIGTIIISGKEIKEIVRSSEKRPDIPGERVVEVSGLHVYPGMIDAGTVLGLVEVGSLRETADFRDGGDFQPDLRAGVAVNPDSELIPVTRANGVTTVVTRPTGGVVAGQAALINLAGWVPAEMAVVDPLALQIEFPPEPGPARFVAAPSLRDDAAAARRQRDEKVKKLRELFEQAKRYEAGRTADSNQPINPRLEALGPYLRKEKPVIIEANRRSEILAALKLADELKIRLIIAGGAEAWKVAGQLAQKDVPVILGPVMAPPREIGDRYDASYCTAGKLHAAGVRFCIRSGGSNNVRNLPYEAAMAVAYGLPPSEGLKAVTTYPAEILGVADRLGDIAAGKRANLVLSTGDILQPTTQVLSVLIDGRPYEPTNKQTRLYEKYRQRLTEVQGSAR